MDEAERKRLGLDRLKQGERHHWGKKDYPKYDKKTRHFKMHCIVCGYTPHHRIYVCPKCGNCQNCGGINVIGVVHQNCQWCGNGSTIKHPDVPTVSTDHQPFDEPNVISRESQEVEPHKKKQSSASVHVQNINDNV